MTQPNGVTGVTVGYMAGGSLVALLWLGVGLLLLPLMAVLAVVHAAAGLSARGAARSHHLWLARHHLWATIALLIVTIAALFTVPAALDAGMTILNTLAYAPHPAETLAAAWPALDLPALIALGVVAFVGWLLVTLWLSVRLIVRWLRWVDRRPA